MEVFFFVLVILNIYVIVYFRLMSKYYEDQALAMRGEPPQEFAGTKRLLRTLGDIFTLPKYRLLPEEGRRYAHGFWIGLGVLALCLAGLVAAFDA